VIGHKFTACPKLNRGRRIFLFQEMIIIKKLIKWVIPLFCGIAVILLLRFILFIGYVPSASMEPTIKESSYVFGYRIFTDIHRGDIVVFRNEGRANVKRVAAVPGDTVYINDTDHSVFMNENIETATRVLTVPDGCFFMLGDNREDSLDSRYWTDPFIMKDQILAKLF